VALRVLFAGIVLLTSPVLAQPETPELKPIPLCEIFKDLRSYAGRTIAVWGQLYSGREIFALGAHCDKSFITKYSLFPRLLGMPNADLLYAWPTALDLAVTSNSDSAAIDRIYDQIRRQRAMLRNRDLQVWVTVVGKLLVKDHYDIGPAADGKLRGDGYGHLSTFPGQLVIQSMSEAVITPKTGESKK